jgi:hypothetical protein
VPAGQEDAEGKGPVLELEALLFGHGVLLPPVARLRGAERAQVLGRTVRILAGEAIGVEGLAGRGVVVADDARLALPGHVVASIPIPWQEAGDGTMRRHRTRVKGRPHPISPSGWGSNWRPAPCSGSRSAVGWHWALDFR